MFKLGCIKQLVPGIEIFAYPFVDLIVLALLLGGLSFLFMHYYIPF